MIEYRAPLDDIEFTLHKLIGLETAFDAAGFENISGELISDILNEAARIAADVLSPINRNGDLSGARLTAGKVCTPPGWLEAYKIIMDGNWIGLPFPEAHGGAELPTVINAAVSEMWQAANMAFTVCPMLTQGAIDALESCGSDEQKQTFLPNLMSGRWTGTMNLTEAGAGSDLGAIKTIATKDGSTYRIRGQKIFITYGEHDLAENIIHLVLARTPDAPAGVKGISLFVVPKYLVDQSGKLGEANDVRCLSLEHKLGIHGSPTAVMAFGENEGAQGYLVGQENRGLEHMFIMMNNARLNVGIQGLGISERAFQAASSYSRERVQGKPIGAQTGAPIINHPDVHRILITMKAQIQAMRGIAYSAAFSLDKARRRPEDRAAEMKRAEFLIPIVKGWCTESAVSITSQAIQVLGGLGYIEESGVAQFYRDARIAPIYEGTTAIQANDLVNRKIIRDRGEVAFKCIGEVSELGEALSREACGDLQLVGERIREATNLALQAISWLVSIDEPSWQAAASVPLLELLGVVLGAQYLARGALIESRSGISERSEVALPRITLAHHYNDTILSRAFWLYRCIVDGSRNVMAIPTTGI